MIHHKKKKFLSETYSCYKTEIHINGISCKPKMGLNLYIRIQVSHPLICTEFFVAQGSHM